jgi:hypothetical protein
MPQNECININNIRLVRLRNCLPTKLEWKKQVKDLWTVHFGLKTQNEQCYKLLASGIVFTVRNSQFYINPLKQALFKQTKQR